ncbi:fungal-specific transcription factor domain-containing protein [Microdochium trichocladiopsis]|uniref:Fungal-specific transcription factor domain-containing protein n=1 Tax=Microdochium trichocladiopsis TaxID=1682393 RepID=A0A9P9BN37_9PEZI|nr:fungal-specific transcription factor domain-containing protein [Microdochium trichocladiopsis]KAH7018437.1 fungal-specific transcription factor domain-containing protein [Microdochium trichocladiopsis]
MATTSNKKAAEAEAPKPDVSNQENVTARSNSTKSANKSQVRHRASVACASCRDRRIRCVVPKGENECTQCKRTGTECIIKNDDERRRPISKAYMSSLSDRINMLEGMLLDKGVVPPPPRHPPKTRHGSQTKTEDVQDNVEGSPEPEHKQANGLRQSPIGEVPSPPDSASDDYVMHDSPGWPEGANVAVTDFQPLPKEQSPFRNLDPKQEDIVHRLLSTKGNLSFDQLSGRLRFFGPTANSHVYADSADKYDAREPAEQVRRAQRIIRSLSSDTYNYLMDTFWEYYNSVLHVIDQEAFEGDRDSQNPKFYSSFLHITVLAMGYFYSDKTRDDMKRITLGSRESTLHREAKYMLDTELEKPGGISSVQALLILGDLECGLGRDNTGWMYAGMSNRLAFDVGLHLDCSNNGLPERDVRIRQMVMRSCILYDKYWALFLGRPTSIKSQDIGMDLLAQRFTELMSPKSAKSLKPASLADQRLEIYEQLYELMELAGRIVEIRDIKSKRRVGDHDVFSTGEVEDNAYLHVVNLDRQLQNWYRRLPDHLTWKPTNIKTAEFPFFLLHQQYHVTMILLHRPWAKYTTIGSAGTGTSSQPSPGSVISSPVRGHHDQLSTANNGQALGLGDPNSLVHDSRTSLSRSICTQQAIRVARIFWQHRQRFEGKRMFVTGIQHAGTASIALIAALAYQQSEAERRSYMSYLEILSQAINDMSETYQPAERMDSLLEAVLTQVRGDAPENWHLRTNSFAGSVAAHSGSPWPDNSAYSMLPVRREHPDAEYAGVNKKRLRPGPSRRASEIPRPRPTFGTASSAANQLPSSSHLLSNSGQQHASQSLSGFFPTFGESTPFFDTMNGSAIDIDHNDDVPTTRSVAADDYVLVPPPADDWSTMNGLAGDDPAGHGTSCHDFGFQMSDFVSSGAPGMSASTPSLHDPRLTGSVLSGLGASSSHLHHLHSDNHAGGTLSGDEHKAIGESAMEWINNEGTGLNSVMGIENNDIQDASDGRSSRLGANSSAGTRNHELDFFSF